MVEGLKTSNNLSNLHIYPKDVLTVKINQDLFDMDEAESYAKVVKELFPKNDILVVFNGIDIGIIHKEGE